MHRTAATVLIAGATLLGLGCHSTTSSGGVVDMAMGGGGTGGTGGGGGGGTGGSGGGGGGTTGGNTITGTTPQGGSFGTVATAWFIGHPDSNTTTVVYMFSKAVDCHDAAIHFGTMGWDMNLPANTQFMELKSFGPIPAVVPPTPKGDYTVTTSMNPTTGEASINHSLAPGGGTASNETIGNSGKITITDITAAKVTGSFTVGFPTPPGGVLAGTFDAAFCDVGVEP